jgi:valyl-tRNA synthetase
MLHPFMPFITEELWHALGDRPYDLIHAKWPAPAATPDAEASAEIEWVQAFIAQVRATKSDLGVPPSKTVTAMISKVDDRQFGWLNANLLAVKRMARLDQITVRTPEGFRELSFDLDGTFISGDVAVDAESEGKVQLVADGIFGSLDFFGVIDLDAERARITKGIEAASKEAASLAGRLNNPAFVEKATPEAVDKARADHAEKSAEVERLQAALTRLG